MPFGPDCEFATFDDCVKKHRGKKNPEGYCAKIQDETEGHCKKRMERMVRSTGDQRPPHRRYKYDVQAASYTEVDTGIVLSPARLNELIGDFLSQQQQRMVRFTDDLVQGHLAIPEWEIEIRRVIKESYGASYLLGRGGRKMMTQSDWGRVGQMVRNQYLYLNMFAREIATGEITAEEALRRIAIYPGGGRHAFGRARSIAQGDIPLPAYPGDGSTQCLGHCMCSWQIEDHPEGGWNATWVLGDADHCQECLRRSDTWAPLRIGGPVHA